MAFVTHHCKVGSLKQYTFIPLKFWRSEVRGEAYRAKVSLSVVLSGGSTGESIPGVFCLMKVMLFPGLMTLHFLHLSSPRIFLPLLCTSPPHLLLFCNRLSFQLPFTKTLVMAFQAHFIAQDNLLTSRFLIIPAVSTFPLR